MQTLTLLARVRALFGVDVALMTFLREPTVAGLAALVAAELPSASPHP